MQIGNPDLDNMYEEIYRSIAQECGLKIFRVDKDNEGDLIKKTIDKYIEEAEIIIADLTNERPSCYHEVGYAYGLRKYLPQSQAKFHSKSQTFFHSCKTKKLKFISSLLESFSPEARSINLNYSRIMNHSIQYG